jgi:hypothetical protein
LKVIDMSGYTASVSASRGVLEEAEHVLQTLFSIAVSAVRVWTS